MDLLVVLLAGAFTGWLTGGVIKRGGLGTVGDVLGGACGAACAAYIPLLTGLFDVEIYGLAGDAIAGAVGALIIVLVIHLAISD